jgi:hypothetical protein
MVPLSICKPFLSHLHFLFVQEPINSVFQNRLQPRDQRPVTYISAVPGSLFTMSPRGAFFFTSWPGTHTHCHIFQIQAHTFDTLQILFTLGIWLLSVQVLAHRSSTSSLQVYIQHWHVVYPTELHLHFQSHPLILSFRILIPGSAVPKPPLCICGTATR